MASGGALPHAVHDAIDHALAIQTVKVMRDLLEQLAREWLRQADGKRDRYAAGRRDSARELLAAINRGGRTS